MEIPQEAIQFILNKLAVINEEMGGIQGSMAVMRIDIEILKIQMADVLKLLWAIIFGIGGIITFVIGKSIVIRVNNKGGK